MPTLVKFTKSCSPYCAGELRQLSKAQLKEVDERAKKFNRGTVYEEVKKTKKPSKSKADKKD